MFVEACPLWDLGSLLHSDQEAAGQEAFVQMEKGVVETVVERIAAVEVVRDLAEAEVEVAPFLQKIAARTDWLLGLACRCG